SRCLDLMAQTEKVGNIRIHELNSKVLAINRTLKMAEKMNEIARQSTAAYNLSVRMNVQKAVVAMAPRVHAQYKKLQNHVINDEAPVLKLSFSQVVLNHIANLGKGIMTN
ncbi:hypothetical protein PFISCL1PPCAC_22009, partial [Pristionchus fissidentatus]